MPRTNTIHHKKRTGQHHKHGKHYKKVYWPYIPVLVVTGLTFVFSFVKSPLRNGVLAYATRMSTGELLEKTNQIRQENQSPGLQLSTLLNEAAQAKAQDMAAKDYWSHNTPDGKEPWYFVDQSGYQYVKAGENLAYGFLTPGETVAGWMNSPSHRSNMLDSEFTEVGFGFAHVKNFQGTGEETVVVAMYGKPLTTSNQAVPAQNASQALGSSGNYVAANSNTPVSRVAAIVGDASSWMIYAVGLVSGLAASGLLLSHGIRLRRVLTNGERWVLHHPLLDMSLVSLMLLGAFLSQTVGRIL